MGKSIVIPYLGFAGCCEEAIRTYIGAFGGEVYYLSRWPEGAQAGQVMHAEFALGGTRMAAGDDAQYACANTAVKLMIRMETMEEAQRAVDLLAQGGQVISPLRPHPAPDDAGCGSVTRDRFGYTWIVDCPNPAK